MSRSLPPRPHLERLKREAKELKKAHQAKEPAACARIRDSHPKFHGRDDAFILRQDFPLRSAQRVIAREYGFDSWRDLRTATVPSAIDRWPARTNDERQCDAQDFKAIIAACESGQLDKIQRLIGRAPHLIHQMDWYRTPLHFAVLGHHAELVRWLLERGADPSPADEVYVGDSILQIARTRGQVEIASMIELAIRERAGDLELRPTLNELDLDADPTWARVVDTSGATALHAAVARRDRPLVDRLIELGSPIDWVRNDGFHPVTITYQLRYSSKEQNHGDSTD